MRVEIDMGWISTDGRHWPAPCDVVTEDEGETFYCKTHQQSTWYEQECPSRFTIETLSEGE